MNTEEKAMFTRTDGKEIIVVGKHARLFTKTKQFQLWMEKIDSKITMDYLELRDVFMGGVNKDILLFATVEGINAKFNGEAINAYAFLRSDAAAMLSFVEEEGTGFLYAVIIEQCRFPYGGTLYECPAGMLDDAVGFKGVAAKEIEEELGEKISSDKLTSIGSAVMSGGGCPERIHFVVFKMRKSRTEIDVMRHRRTGCKNENEDIKLHIIPFQMPGVTRIDFLDNLYELNPDYDAKILTVLTLYDQFIAKGGII